MESAQVASYDKIKQIVSFHNKPDAVSAQLAGLALTGYESPPSSLWSVIESFLEGAGIPHPSLGDEVGLQDLAEGVGEELDDVGARSRLFLLAATGSRALMPSTRPVVCILFYFYSRGSCLYDRLILDHIFGPSAS